MISRKHRIQSIYAIPKPDKHRLLIEKSINIRSIRLTIGNLIGIILSLITIAVQSTAVFTSHWKEISPKVSSLYIEGVDALIRHEVLVYFNTVHRYSRQTYGLFYRCEYSSKMNSSMKSFGRIKLLKSCTKNFLPSYVDEEFDECHSIEYYRFCSQTNTKIFDVGNDYLRAKLGLTSSETFPMSSSLSCHCSYPTSILACQIFGILAVIFLSLTGFISILFPFLLKRHQRLTAKLFLLSTILLGIIFTFLTVFFVSKYLTYETVAYLTSIEQHYRFKEIYTLASDVKTSIDRFLASLEIRFGYSTTLAQIAVILSLIDGILLTISCKVQYDFSHLSEKLHRVDQEKETHADIDDAHDFHCLPSIIIEEPNDIEEKSSQTLYVPTLKNHQATT